MLNPPLEILSETVPKKVKKPRYPMAIRPYQFYKPKGLYALYKISCGLNIDQGEINIYNTMKKIVFVMKSWQFYFVPKYQFNYFLKRCHALGTHKILGAYMYRVRRIHKKQESWSDPVTVPKKEGNIMQALYNIHDMGHRVIYNGANDSEDDEDFRYLMLKMYKQQIENRAKKGKYVDEKDYKVSYVPEGYDYDYDDSD